ncbi:ATP-dependent helicase [Leptolyngbya sp. 'hensonii']|uniref:DEAD/DEAH box helicase n=1 Tax=Leptolyngbya sp. 'hensonii' TaxID=1922337 RepID=UPI00094FD977|nr:DEAD/DEAH box helicase [Leptolyngbya sp. 'hensonii']OLP19035.1 ATP-dependent helicase [Leptolyngbya sp. 'hensonii']
MAILHGNWLVQGYLFIWAEAWRRTSAMDGSHLHQIPPHPLALPRIELIPFLQSLQERGSLPQLPDLDSLIKSQIVVVPTGFKATLIMPQHSAVSREALDPDLWDEILLQPWRVEGICLEPLTAVRFLQALPLSSVDAGDSFVGPDLRFWSHVGRWSLDLMARSKFLPGLERQAENALARWQPLLDSATDQARLSRFIHQMPTVGRLYRQGQEADGPEGQEDPAHTSLSIPLPSEPEDLLRSFLAWTIDARVRTLVGPLTLPTSRRSEQALEPWLQSLGSKPTTLTIETSLVERLETLLNTWTAPIQRYLSGQSSFCTCFYLHPPQPGQVEWTLEYFLQAADDPEFLIDARTIWNFAGERLTYLGRTIERPQETFLAGLGLASRLYPLIEPSLQSQRPQYCRLHPLQVYEFVKNTAWRLQDSGFGVVLPPSLSQQEGWANRLGLKVRAETPSKKDLRLGLQSLLNFKWELSIGGQTLSKAEFDRLVTLNTPLVEINGEWVELRPQDVRAAQNFFVARKEQMSLSLEDALRISTGDNQLIEKLPVVSFEASGALEELINTLTTGNQNIQAIDPPPTFKGTLRPYQARGVGWLAFLERWGLGACLADDMGLGKTIELIAFLLVLQEQGGLQQPTLLVCPTSVLGNWEREVKKFGPSLKTLVYHGDKRPKGKNLTKAIQGKELIITSYALIQRDIKDLATISWQGVVLDEAQNIKNSEAKQSQAVRQIQAQFRIALTGTPVENRLSELWSILDFLNPGYLGARNFFQRRFAIPIEKYGDTASLKTLRSLVQPFILRRVKTDREIIQDLPEKQEMAVFCSLTAEQASLYQKAVDQSLVDIESAEGIQRHGLILALLTKLKQICNHPAHFLKETGGKKAAQNQSSFRQRSGKVQRLEEMLEVALAEGDRALIFTQFAEWGKLLKAHLEEQLGQEILYLYGATSKKQREDIVDRFQNDPQGPRILLLSLKAGGVGLNLTRANHVFHFDRWWNPAVENQATDRAFRIGQTRNVQVHKFVVTGTLEEKIHDLIESKKALADQVVGTGENWLTELDTDQLRNLLLLDRAAIIDEE